MTQTLEFTIEEVNAYCNVSNNAKNRQIVLNLYEKGILDIKDAINQVADRLTSQHTVLSPTFASSRAVILWGKSNAFCPDGDWPAYGTQQASSALQFAKAVLRKVTSLPALFYREGGHTPTNCPPGQ
ncbi:helix-turn-helix domain-containing protein [Shigella flexneri]